MEDILRGREREQFIDNQEVRVRETKVLVVAVPRTAAASTFLREVFSGFSGPGHDGPWCDIPDGQSSLSTRLRKHS